MKRKYDIPAWRQFHLMRLALRHHEMTKADCAVLAEIVQRYHGEYGNAWSSYEMLIEDTGFTRATVKRARRKLERLGFVTVLSTGRKGHSTVYLPNFELIPEKRVTNDPLLNGVKDDPEKDTLGVTHDPESTEYGVKDDPPSYLHVPADKAGIHERYIDPSAPPLAGLSAASAGENGEGEKSKFDELYKAYGHRRNRADARKAYEALEPDADDHADMVAAALSWREGWERQNNPDAPRITLAKWLEQERFHEDPPTGFKAKERKPPKATVKHDVSAPVKEPVAETGDVSMSTPVGTFIAEITNGDVLQAGNEIQVSLEMTLHDDAGAMVATTSHTFFPQSYDKSWQEKGQIILRKIADATGLAELNDTQQLHGKRCRVTINNRREITYHNAG